MANSNLLQNNRDSLEQFVGKLTNDKLSAKQGVGKKEFDTIGNMQTKEFFLVSGVPDLLGKGGKSQYIYQFDMVQFKTNRNIGHISFTTPNPTQNLTSNITYEVKEAYRNKGLATKALKMVCNLAKALGFKMLWA